MGSAAAHLHFCEWKQSQQTLFRVCVCVFSSFNPPHLLSLFVVSHLLHASFLPPAAPPPPPLISNGSSFSRPKVLPNSLLYLLMGCIFSSCSKQLRSAGRAGKHDVGPSALGILLIMTYVLFER